MRLSPLTFAELSAEECGAGFSQRGTSVPLERLAGTCGRLAEATPQAEARPTSRIHRASIIALTLASIVAPGFADLS